MGKANAISPRPNASPRGAEEFDAFSIRGCDLSSEVVQLSSRETTTHQWGKA